MYIFPSLKTCKNQPRYSLHYHNCSYCMLYAFVKVKESLIWDTVWLGWRIIRVYMKPYNMCEANFLQACTQILSPSPSSRYSRWITSRLHPGGSLWWPSIFPSVSRGVSDWTIEIAPRHRLHTLYTSPHHVGSTSSSLSQTWAVQPICQTQVIEHRSYVSVLSTRGGPVGVASSGYLCDTKLCC